MEIIAVKDHYEILRNGEFFCSCDNWDEVVEEMRALTQWQEESPLAS